MRLIESAIPVRGMASSSCDPNDWVCPQNAELGYTIVLPGIWGSRPLEHGIVAGLVQARVPCAIDLYDWTAGPLFLVYNLRAWDRNRKEAEKIAAKIVAYQDRYPGRPVNLIGYSGGGAIAVLALEALPPGRKVSSAILLAPTLAPDYDLQSATRRTEQGIHSFYSPLDVPLLMVMTSVLGTSEGRHAIAAGALGFEEPIGADDGQAGEARLTQQRYTGAMLLQGHPGGHFGWSSPAFVAHWVAPMLGSPIVDGAGGVIAAAHDAAPTPDAAARTGLHSTSALR